MKAEELLSNNLAHDLPFVNTYDVRYADTDINVLLSDYQKDPIALYELATRYKDGKGGASKDYQKAYEYYEKVLYYQRNVRAMYWLGVICLFYLPEHKQESLVFLKAASDLNDRDADWLLGYIYLDEPTLADKDHEKAYHYFNKAHEAGKAETDLYLARALDGLGRYTQAKPYYEKALASGFNEANNYLGYMYYAGNGVDVDHAKAMEYFRNSYKFNNSPYAALVMGMMLKDGTAEEQYQSYRYLLEASEKGYKQANILIGDHYYFGIENRLEIDLDKAAAYYLKAADDDKAQAYYHAALIYSLKTDEENMIRCLFESARLGFAPALEQIGKSYKSLLRYAISSDNPVITQYDSKYDEADIETVAEQSKTDLTAAYELASRYRLGEQGVDQDFNKAAEQYARVLLKQKHSGAFCWLGKMLYDGNLGENNQELAMEYYKAAYSLGNAEAAVQLGLEYEIGTVKGYEVDLDKALSYYQYAKEHGRGYLNASIGGIYEKMGERILAHSYYQDGVRENDPYAMFSLGLLLIDEGSEQEGMHWINKAANMGNEYAIEYIERQKPTPQQYINAFENAFKHISEEDVFNEVCDIIKEGYRYYPKEPEIVIRYIRMANIISYAHKMKGTSDEVYDEFVTIFNLLLELKQYAPSSMTDAINRELSFCSTHIADMELEKGRDDQAVKALSYTDPLITPYSAVVKFHYLLKQMSYETTEKPSAAMVIQLKEQMDVMEKTVKDPDSWNSRIERGLAYTAMSIVYGTQKLYEPYIRYNSKLAADYRKKADELLGR